MSGRRDFKTSQRASDILERSGEVVWCWNKVVLLDWPWGVASDHGGREGVGRWGGVREVWEVEE